MISFALVKACTPTRRQQTSSYRGSRGIVLWIAALILAWLGMAGHAQAQETVCARVKIQILQQLTMERQGFDAEMKIINTLTDQSLSEVSVVVKAVLKPIGENDGGPQGRDPNGRNYNKANSPGRRYL